MERSRDTGIAVIIILAALAGFGPMSIDMYLPSLPTITADLGVDPSQVQLTLSAFFVGIALGQLLYGPLSDRFGRIPVLKVGISLYILASIACAMTSDVNELIAMRFIQALGGGAGAVLSRAMVRDLWSGDAAARILSYMMMVMSVAPLIAPFIGGYVLLFQGWRAIFWVLAGFGGLCLAAVMFRLPETHTKENRKPLSIGDMAAGYLRVFSHRQSLGFMLTGSFAFAGMFAYIAGTPFVYIEYFGVSPQEYGYLFGANIVMMVIGSFFNGRLVQTMGSRKMLGFGVSGVLLGGILLVAASVHGGLGLPGVFFPLLLSVGLVSMIGANSVAGALQPFPDIAGTAAAMYGTLQFGAGAVAGIAVAALQDGTPLPMAAIICCTGLLSMLSYLTMTGEKKA